MVARIISLVTTVPSGSLSTPELPYPLVQTLVAKAVAKGRKEEARKDVSQARVDDVSQFCVKMAPSLHGQKVMRRTKPMMEHGPRKRSSKPRRQVAL